MLSFHKKQTIYAIKDPAMQAVRKQAIDPAMYARKAILAKSCRLSGAMVEKHAIWIPTDAGLLKPQSAKVAIVFDRSEITPSNLLSSAYATNSFTKLFNPINLPTLKQS